MDLPPGGVDNLAPHHSIGDWFYISGGTLVGSVVALVAALIALCAVRKQIKSSTEDTGDQIEANAVQVRKQIRANARQVRRQINATVDQTREQITASADHVARQIKANEASVARQIAASEAAVAAQIEAEREHRREDETRRLNAEKRAQAEQVTAWVRKTGTGLPAWIQGDPRPPNEPYLELGLANASSGAIYDLHIDVKCLPGINVREDIVGYVRLEHEAHAWLAVLPPNHTATYTIALPERSTSLVDVADIHFRDQRGQRWVRAAQGGELSPSEKLPFEAPTYDENGPWDPLEEDGYIEVQHLGED